MNRVNFHSSDLTSVINTFFEKIASLLFLGLCYSCGLFLLYESCVVALFLYGGLLIVFGLLSMYSVSIFESFDLTSGSEFLEISNYYFFNDHIKKLLVGLVICVGVWYTPLRWIKQSKYVIFIGSAILVGLLFSPLVDTALLQEKGARLWLDIPGGTLQPGEFFKLGYVFFLSSRLLRKKKILEDRPLFLGFLIVVALCCFIFLLLPDIGSLFVLGPVSLILFRYAGGRPFYVVVTLILGVMSVFLASLQFDYVQDRLAYFFGSEDVTTDSGIGWQTQQSLIAVGGGGLIGRGYGKGLQKFGYIPEAQSDFIFAAFSEEIGFLGGSILLTLYFLLGRYVLRRLDGISDPYERMLAVGMVSLILIQAFVNIGVNIKLIPLTGITLPFISHGGSALLVNMLEVVLLAKIIEGK